MYCDSYMSKQSKSEIIYLCAYDKFVKVFIEYKI